MITALVATTSIALFGTPVIDGKQTEADKTCVLAIAQKDSHENGSYTVRRGAWSRGCSEPHPFVKYWGSITPLPGGGLLLDGFDIDCDGIEKPVIPDCLEEAIKNSVHDGLINGLTYDAQGKEP